MRTYRGEVLQPKLQGDFSYKSCRDPNYRLIEQWHFMEIIESGITEGNMDNEQAHSESPSKVNLGWNISLEFDSRIHQYSFALVGCDEINKKLVTMSSEISNLRKAFCGEMSISGKDFTLPPKDHRLLDIHSLKLGTAPDLPLKLKPTCFDCQVLVSTMPVVTSPRTVVMRPRSTFGRNLINGLPYNCSTEVTLDFFCHLLLISFCGYYSINNPNNIGGEEVRKEFGV